MVLTNTQKPDTLITSKVEDKVVLERYIRCGGKVNGFTCNKLLTRVFCIAEEVGGPEIKIGVETKCGKCGTIGVRFLI